MHMKWPTRLILLQMWLDTSSGLADGRCVDLTLIVHLLLPLHVTVVATCEDHTPPTCRSQHVHFR